MVFEEQLVPLTGCSNSCTRRGGKQRWEVKGEGGVWKNLSAAGWCNPVSNILHHV